MEGEKELVSFLISQGNAAVLWTDYSTGSIRNQVALAYSADVIVGLHGAALTNAIFMRRGGIVVELKTSYGFSLDLFALVAESRLA
jgi:capsular polysaccharide biosynthesis protein